MGSLRLSPGMMSASLLTSGESAMARKRAAPRMKRPVIALKKMKPAAAKPRITSQKRIKVLVSTSIL